MRGEARFDSVPESWLTKMSYEVQPGGEFHNGVPCKFKKVKLKVGDQFWSYSSPPETWERMCGRMGTALVRQGRIIKTELRMMN